MPQASTAGAGAALQSAIRHSDFMESFHGGSFFHDTEALDLPPGLMMCVTLCRLPHMATNLALDPDLLDRALEVSGERTKKAAVTLALQEFIARREQRKLVSLFGALQWDPGFDYKSERSRS